MKNDNRPDNSINNSDTDIIGNNDEMRTKHHVSRKRYEQIFSIGLITGISVFITGAIAFGITQYKYIKSAATYDNATREFVVINDSPVIATAPDSSDSADSAKAPVLEDVVFEVPWYDMAKVDLDSLKTAAPNSVGWIYFEDNTISYPVMYCSDNETYLNHMYDGSYNAAGSIFMDKTNHVDFCDPYTIIYGHSMKNGSMFGTLKNYRDQNYLDKHPYFQIITADCKYRYQIFAVQVISGSSDYYDISFARDSLMNNRINLFRKYSLVNSSLSPTQDDTIINLSTCSGSENRLFVSAVLIDSQMQ